MPQILQGLFFGIILLSLILIIPSAFADSWYVGKGLKQGDYFRYNVCWIEWHNCTPVEIDFWIKNQTDNGSAWNLEFSAIDGSIIQKGNIMIGTSIAEPTYSDPNVANYSNVYKNTIAWLDPFTNKEYPKNFTYPNWGRVGDDIMSLNPTHQEQVTVKAGTFNAWLIAWHKGVDNKIWIDPNLPFPVKASVYSDVAQGTPPQGFIIELLETGNSQTEPNFLQVSSTSLPTILLSPLKQFKSGIPVNDIRCKQDLTLVTRPSDNSSACVKPTTAFKLVQRGWGSLVISTTKTMNIDNTKFSANYTVSNAEILNIRLDIPSQSVFVTMQASGDGNLIITIPQELFKNSRSDLHYAGLFVIEDGRENEYKEIKTTSTDITLLIPFVNGTKYIEIIGAYY
ncbi:MAG: hypothetical protein ACREAD_05525 [Nitrosopumilaceae archaeon]